MVFEFINKAEDVNGYQFIHIIEHEGHGTLHHLIEPLQEDLNQHVICTYNLVNVKFIREKFSYIIHVTGHMYPIISNLKSLLDNAIDVSIFLHVAPMYFILKEKDFFIDYLINLQRQYKFKCFCPSNEVAKKYAECGLTVESMQIGFPEINDVNVCNDFKLKAYCNRFISVCTSPDPRYIDLKGINEFIDMMEKASIKSEAMILGFDGMYRGVRCKKLHLNSFLYVLANSKAYIQLSKTEAYNLTAVQAKRLKIPLLVSSVDGHIDCMRFSENHIHIADNFEAKMRMASSSECIIQNYNDSTERESLDNFINRVKANVKGA